MLNYLLVMMLVSITLPKLAYHSMLFMDRFALQEDINDEQSVHSAKRFGRFFVILSPIWPIAVALFFLFIFASCVMYLTEKYGDLVFPKIATFLDKVFLGE